MMDKLGITSGRTYMGADAVGAGLVDSIQSFDKSVMKAYSLATNYLDRNRTSSLF
jgi:ClpP class serine protease